MTHIRRVDEISAGWRLSGRLYDGSMTLLATMTPGAALGAAAMLGPLTLRVGTFAGLEQDMRLLLEPLVGTDWGKTARAITRSATRNRVLSCIIRRGGYGAVAPLFTAGSLDRLRALVGKPAVVTVLHNGPILAFHSALHCVDASASILTMRYHQDRPTPVEIIAIQEMGLDHAGQSHLYASAACRNRLLAGGLVFVPMDGSGAADVDVPLLGRRLGVPMGAAVLSVMTGAPIIPAEAKWTTDNRIDLQIGAPLTAPAGQRGREVERTLLEQAIASFDMKLRADPSQMNLTLLDLLLQSPAW